MADDTDPAPQPTGPRTVQVTEDSVLRSLELFAALKPADLSPNGLSMLAAVRFEYDSLGASIRSRLQVEQDAAIEIARRQAEAAALAPKSDEPADVPPPATGTDATDEQGAALTPEG